MAPSSYDGTATVASVYSMTGFSGGTRDLPGGALALELRSVNHRYLEIQFRIPDALRALEPALRERISSVLKRGKVDCRVEWRRSEILDQGPLLNTAALEQLRACSTIVQEVFADATPLSVGEILQWPGVLHRDPETVGTLEEPCLALAAEVLDALTQTRAREGEKLKRFLLQRVDDMLRLLDTLSPQVPALVSAFEERLASRLRDALGTHDEERVRQEVTLYAARIDIEEEISRLHMHLDEVRRILDAGGSIGKRLDFMMQELHREANTLGSKSVSATLARASMDLKVLIEQMREQVQNIE